MIVPYTPLQKLSAYPTLYREKDEMNTTTSKHPLYASLFVLCREVVLSRMVVYKLAGLKLTLL